MLTEAPIEDQLAWHTLWPESHKLYGHGNELFSLCCDHGGKLVASSCKVYGVLLTVLLLQLRLWEVHLNIDLGYMSAVVGLYIIANILVFAGPISSSSRNMAMASGFMEGSWSVAVSQLNCDPDAVLS